MYHKPYFNRKPTLKRPTMDLSFGAHPMYYGPFGVNLTTFFVAALVLAVAAVVWARRKETRLFELSLLIFLVSFSFVTLHGRWLQYVFPIGVPEQPLIDNNLTVNYAVTNALAYAVLPLLVVCGWSRHVSAAELGLKVGNAKQTVKYAVLGTTFATLIFLATSYFFPRPWIQGYTADGLILWVLLVSVASVSLQTLFFVGILFNRYRGKANILLLAIIAVLAFQSYISPASFPWLFATAAGFCLKLFVTWKTNSIYAAIALSVAVNLAELVIQIL